MRFHRLMCLGPGLALALAAGCNEADDDDDSAEPYEPPTWPVSSTWTWSWTRTPTSGGS